MSFKKSFSSPILKSAVSLCRNLSVYDTRSSLSISQSGRCSWFSGADMGPLSITALSDLYYRSDRDDQLPILWTHLASLVRLLEQLLGRVFKSPTDALPRHTTPLWRRPSAPRGRWLDSRLGPAGWSCSSSQALVATDALPSEAMLSRRNGA